MLDEQKMSLIHTLYWRGGGIKMYKGTHLGGSRGAPLLFLPRPEIILLRAQIFLPHPEILYICAPLLFSPVGRQ